MTPATFREALAALNFTQAQAAEFIGVSTRTVERWAGGHSAIPKSVAMVLQSRLEARPDTR